MSICTCGNKKPLNLQPSQKIKEVLGNRGQSSLHFLYRVQKLFFSQKPVHAAKQKISRWLFMNMLYKSLAQKHLLCVQDIKFRMHYFRTQILINNSYKLL